MTFTLGFLIGGISTCVVLLFRIYWLRYRFGDLDEEYAGHTLSVKLDRDTAVVSVDCHEPEGANCRKTCEFECPSWLEDHEQEYGHKLVDYGRCLAVEWMQNDASTAECYLGEDEIPIYDGMPVEVEWQGDFWGWLSLERQGPVEERRIDEETK